VIVAALPGGEGSGLSGAAIGGAVGGGLAALATLAALFLFLLKRRKKEEVEEVETETVDEMESTTIDEPDDYISEYGLSAPDAFSTDEDDRDVDLPFEGESGMSHSDPINISENNPEDLEFQSEPGEGA
jgi:hypothetical protein